MRPSRDLPIQRKMLVMTLLICGAVLCVAIDVLFIFQVKTFRDTFRRDTTTLALVIAGDCVIPLYFNNDEEVTNALRKIQAEPTALSATLVLTHVENSDALRGLKNGYCYAKWGAAESTNTLSLFPFAGHSRFRRGHLLVTQAVEWKGEQIGTLYVRFDYRRTFLALLGFYGRVVLGVIIVSIGLATFLSGRLGRGITGPILQLARTAQVVGEKKDYSVRAVVSNRGDELGRLSESFNEMLSRIQSQDAALSFSQQKMEALINSIDGIVWERTPDRIRFTFISRQSQDILGYEPQAWLETPNFWEEKLQPEDAAKAIQTGHDLAARRQPYSYEYRMMAADGRTVWIRESGTVLVEKGEPVAMRGIFQDITRQKLDEEQLDNLNRQLMDISRQAGMAEVATGVLHNVGNVLNSVSVSATVVTDRLRRSKVDNLRRVTALMREQSGHLAEFLTTDPNGKLLPEYLDAVADQLAGEQTKMITLMTSVGQHIEHIKEIVAMQQSYAKVSGVYENLSVAELVEDALRINAPAFDRHHIDLVREFDRNIPAVCADRHRVLQILINLLHNAKYAMAARSGNDKRIVIRVGMASPDRVKVTVSDNGVGIARDHLTKVFNRGFTTKKDGHGFGLHSGANAANEMGGTLTAHSDGPGKGAEFTLELPVAASARPEEHLLTQGKT